MIRFNNASHPKDFPSCKALRGKLKRPDEVQIFRTSTVWKMAPTLTVIYERHFLRGGNEKTRINSADQSRPPTFQPHSVYFRHDTKFHGGPTCCCLSNRFKRQRIEINLRKLFPSLIVYIYIKCFSL